MVASRDFYVNRKNRAQEKSAAESTPNLMIPEFLTKSSTPISNEIVLSRWTDVRLVHDAGNTHLLLILLRVQLHKMFSNTFFSIFFYNLDYKNKSCRNCNLILPLFVENKGQKAQLRETSRSVFAAQFCYSCLCCFELKSISKSLSW